MDARESLVIQVDGERKRNVDAAIIAINAYAVHTRNEGSRAQGEGVIRASGSWAASDALRWSLG